MDINSFFLFRRGYQQFSINSYMFQQQKARKNSAFKMENINKNMKSMLYVYIYIYVG